MTNHTLLLYQSECAGSSAAQYDQEAFCWNETGRWDRWVEARRMASFPKLSISSTVQQMFEAFSSQICDPITDKIAQSSSLPLETIQAAVKQSFHLMLAEAVRFRNIETAVINRLYPGTKR